MQSAQWRARDVARKNDLSQIQTAIITSQQDKWKWPELTDTGARAGMAISWDIVVSLQNAWMTQVPTDPNGSNSFEGLWATTVSDWKYWYMVTTRNSVADGWFVLMAKTEVEWSSNWIVCGSQSEHEAGSDAGKTSLQTYWIFNVWVDLKHVVTCSEFDKKTDGSCQMDGSWKCTYTDEESLRYILVY